LPAQAIDPDKGSPQDTLVSKQPQLMVPNRALRILEQRTYQSHSEAKARRKIEMFNDGEIPIFREAGFETVFFENRSSAPVFRT
jgi:hypothetical protein